MAPVGGPSKGPAGPALKDRRAGPPERARQVEGRRPVRRPVGMLAAVLKVVGVLVAVLLSVVALAYAFDYGLEATITEVDCGPSPNPFFPIGLASSHAGSVTVRTKLMGILHTVELPQDQCAALRPDNFVVYHLRSGHTILYEDASKARCLYDSERGVPC